MHDFFKMLKVLQIVLHNWYHFKDIINIYWIIFLVKVMGNARDTINFTIRALQTDMAS